MILRLLGLRLRPTLPTLSKQPFSLRPTIKMSDEKFQITIDVHQFTRDEIRVKARPEYVIIEGKQERKIKNGYIVRKFIRKLKLPPGCNPSDMKSDLSEEGLLTITASRKTCETNLPCETIVPICYSGPSDKEIDECFVKVMDPTIQRGPDGPVMASQKKPPDEKGKKK